MRQRVSRRELAPLGRLDVHDPAPFVARGARM